MTYHDELIACEYGAIQFVNCNYLFIKINRTSLATMAITERKFIFSCDILQCDIPSADKIGAVPLLI